MRALAHSLLAAHREGIGHRGTADASSDRRGGLDSGGPGGTARPGGLLGDFFSFPQPPTFRNSYRKDAFANQLTGGFLAVAQASCGPGLELAPPMLRGRLDNHTALELRFAHQLCEENWRTFGVTQIEMQRSSALAHRWHAFRVAASSKVGALHSVMRL